MKTLLATLALLLIVGATPAAQLTDTYVVWDLGIPVEDGTFSRAEAINNHGEVVGEAGNRPFIWTATRGAEFFLGDVVGFALDVNDRSEVVGHYATPGPTRGFLWSREAGFVDLGDFLPYEINELGQVAGQCSDGVEACIWDQGAITRLGNLGGFGSVTLGINDVGEAVGYSSTVSGEFHAFLWTSSTGMIDLGMGDASNSRAVAINDKQQVAGNRCCGPVGLAATVWFRGTVTIPETDAITDASDINESGMVVGMNWTSNRAFVWLPPGPLVDLPHLPGSDLGQATSVNDNGVVVGIERGPNGMARAVMWAVDGPERPPLDVPRTKDDCKRGGWSNLVRSNGTPFKNQGTCVSYVNTGK